jgi:hypothetical protein
MAKRARGTGRPGKRRPTQRDARPGSRTVPAGAAPTPLSAEQPPAGELEPAIPEAYRPEPAAGPAVRPGPAAQPFVRGRGGATLAVRAADEYRYVARDIRRIAIVGGAAFAIEFALFLLIDVFGIIRI